MDFPGALVLGLIAMLGLGISNAISKVPSLELGSRKTVFLRGITLSVILFLVLLSGAGAVFDLRYMGIAAFIAVLGYLPLVFYYKALKVGKVGVVAPVANSSVVFTVLFSVLFFGEAVSGMQLLSIGAIVAGVFLVSADPRNLGSLRIFDPSSGIPYALVACFLWGVVFFLFKIPVGVLGPVLTSLITETVVMLAALTDLAFLSGKRLSICVPSRSSLLHILALGVCGATGMLAYNYGIMAYGVSLIAAIAFANPMVAAIYGKLFYGEKLTLLQDFAIAAIVAGIALLNYAP